MDIDFDLQEVTGAKENNPIVPLFLLKTYSILETVPTSIISWSVAGDSFIVRDVEKFSDQVIPAHFKHSKFSSFVRQLNFYGFRKVKGKLSGSNKSEQNLWEFRHPYFLKGQPEMLTEIKRSSSHGDDDSHIGHMSNSGEVLELRQQVSKLNDKIDSLSKIVADMQVIIQRYQQGETASKSPVSVVNAMPTLDAFDENVEEEWCLDDDEMMRSLLEDISVPNVSSAPTIGNPLKRKRSFEEFSSSLSENSNLGTVTDPALVSAVANALALSASTAATAGSAAVPVGNFEQYVKAVAAIVNCTGIPPSNQNTNILQQVANLNPTLQGFNTMQQQLAVGI